MLRLGSLAGLRLDLGAAPAKGGGVPNGALTIGGAVILIGGLVLTINPPTEG